MKIKLISFLLFIGCCIPSDGYGQQKKHPRQWKKIVLAPAILTGIGLYTRYSNSGLNDLKVARFNYQELSNVKTHIDDYIQYAPLLALTGLKLANIESKNDWINTALLIAKSEIVATATVLLLKQTTKQLRPDSTSRNSFPSGHTTQAFVAATILHKEMGQKSIWYSIGAYTCATSVGFLRVAKNRHWLSDALIGSGIGILSVQLVYATHQHRWGKKNDLTLVPTHSATSGTGFYFAYKL